MATALLPKIDVTDVTTQTLGVLLIRFASPPGHRSSVHNDEMKQLFSDLPVVDCMLDASFRQGCEYAAIGIL